MLEHVEIMFDDMLNMMKKLKKASYEKNMIQFRENNNHFLFEMTEFVEKEENHNEAANYISRIFVNSIKEAFSKKGKMGSRKQVDLNFFMIYYVFPALLLTESEYASLIADSICKLWGATFKDSNISYTNYDKLYNSFREKIFGLF